MLGHLQVCSPFDSEKNQIANYSCELQLRMQLKMCIIAIFKNIFVCDLIEVVNKVRLGQHRLVIKNHVCCIQWIAQKNVYDISESQGLHSTWVSWLNIDSVKQSLMCKLF